MARELAPAGLRSSPRLFEQRAGPLRAPAGASSLATASSLLLQIATQKLLQAFAFRIAQHILWQALLLHQALVQEQHLA